jgi:hypothetical protein
MRHQHRRPCQLRAPPLPRIQIASLLATRYGALMYRSLKIYCSPHLDCCFQSGGASWA